MDVLDGMRTFVASVEAGSFTAAAQRLGISKKLVSKYMAQLEGRLGVRLLHRTTRSLSLSDDGRKYYARCKELIEAFEEMESSIGSRTGSLRGNLRLAAPSTFGEMYLQPMLQDFGRTHGQLTMELILGDRHVDLAGEGVDMALRIGNLADSGMRARKLGQTELWAIASPEYLADNPAPMTPGELKKHHCIRDTNMVSPNAWPFTCAGQLKKIPVNGRYMVNSARAVRDMVLGHEGIGLCPDYVVAEDVARGRLQRVLARNPSLSLDINAVFLDARYMPAKVRTLLDFLIERFNRARGWENLA